MIDNRLLANNSQQTTAGNWQPANDSREQLENNSRRTTAGNSWETTAGEQRPANNGRRPTIGKRQRKRGSLRGGFPFFVRNGGLFEKNRAAEQIRMQ